MAKNGLLMKIAPVPAYERERLKALNDYVILDTEPESDFNAITDMASMICNVPIALISFIDANRHWFKSHRGIIPSETIRDDSFSTYAINFPNEVLVVSDLSKDERFSNNLFVTGQPYVLFYAGTPLVNPDGFVIGTLSVLDLKPNSLDAKQIKALDALGKQVIAQLELRKKNRQLEQKQTDLQMAQTDLEQIAFLASHDLKTPLNNILSLVDLLQSEYGRSLGDDGSEYIQYIIEAANVASGMITGILGFSRAAKLVVTKKDFVSLDWLMKEVTDTLKIPENTNVFFLNEGKQIYTAVDPLRQILLHLIRNAIQYGDKPKNSILVSVIEEKNGYIFNVKDNGEGISDDDKKVAFTLFKRLKNRDKTAENMGVGLAIVKRLVEKLGGNISIQDASPQGGTSVTFTLPK